MDDNDSFGECNMSEEASKEVGRGKYVKHDSAKVAAPVNKVNLGVSFRKVAAEQHFPVFFKRHHCPRKKRQASDS